MGGNSTVNVDGLTVVHQGSGGTAAAEPPDVCLTPAPAGPPVPTPYPNMALSSDLNGGTTTVKVDGMPVAIQGCSFVKSCGDEAGVGGGVVSGMFMSEATFISQSPTVTLDGMPVHRLSDKMLMNKANTVCLSGEVQAPLSPATPAYVQLPPPEQPRVCKFEKLKVRCGHDSRTHVADPEQRPGAILQVITAQKSEKLHIDFESDCSIHGSSPGCAEIHVVGPGLFPRQSSRELEVAADHTVELPLSKYGNTHFSDLRKVVDIVFGGALIPSDIYTVYATTCQGTSEQAFLTGDFVTVEAFPNSKIYGEVELGFKQAVEKPQHAGQRGRVLEGQGSWDLKGGFKVAVGRVDYSFEVGRSGKGTHNSTLFVAAQRSLNKMCQLFASLQSFYAKKFDISFPNFKLGGEYELAESEDQGTVCRNGKAYLIADKLIGASFTVDLLEWLIVFAATALTGPGAAALVKFLNKLAAKKQRLRGDRYGDADDASRVGGSLDVGVFLTVGGDIGGGIGLKWTAGECAPDEENSKIEAGLSMKLEALAKVEAKLCVVKSFCVEGATGASLSIQSADGKSPSRASGKLGLKAPAKKKAGAQQEKPPEVEGVIEWNGLAIYYLLYADVSSKADFASMFDSDGATEQQTKAVSKKPKTSSELKRHTELAKDSQELATLFPAWRWPALPSSDSAKPPSGSVGMTY